MRAFLLFALLQVGLVRGAGFETCMRGCSAPASFAHRGATTVRGESADPRRLRDAAVSAFTTLAADSIPPKSLTLSVSPRIATAPATIRIRVRVHPDPDDRWIAVDLDGEAFTRSSAWEITNDQPLYTWDYKDVPMGEYDITARIGHQGGKICASDRQSVIVSGFGL